MPADQMSAEGLLPGLLTFQCAHMVEEAENTNPIHVDRTLMT